VNRFDGEVTIGRGLRGCRRRSLVNLSGGRLHGRYDIESDELIIDEIALAGDRTRVGGEIRVRDVSSILRARRMSRRHSNVSLPSMRLDAPGIVG
jgi:hypothetical protein